MAELAPRAFRDRVRGAFASRWAPWVILAVTLAVALPSFQLGFYNDDHALRGAVRGMWPGAPPRWDLYNFASGDPAENQRAIAIGVLPWWTAPDLRLHLVRPLPSLVFTLEHTLFGDVSAAYHAHSVVWYLALVAAVGRFFRRLTSAPTAHLGMLIFGVASAHFFPFGWISCRHMLLAAVPMVLGIDAFVRDPERRGRWVLAVATALALASSESALGAIAFPIAFVALGRAADERTPRSLARSLGPMLLVVGAYLVFYVLVGGGARGSDGYVDPASAPLRFVVKAAGLLPVLVANALLGVPAEIATIAPIAPLAALGIVAALLAGALAWLARDAIDGDEARALRWLVPAAVLALVPSLGGFPGARILLLPNLGIALLIAVLIRRGSSVRRWPARVGAGLLVLLHVALPMLANVGNGSYHAGIARTLEGIAQNADFGPNRPRVFVLGASDPMVTMYVPAVVDSAAKDVSAMPIRCWSVLSAAKQGHVIERTGEDEVVLRPEQGRLVEGPFETLYRTRAHPFSAGEEAHQCGAVFRVTRIDAGRPTEVLIRFDRPLDDPSLRFLVWREGGLRVLTLPPVGGTVVVPWSAGPLGAF